MSRGYTLIEMLISVAIFSALIIIVLATVSSSSSSSARVNSLREKTEATRSVVDQISSDFRYIYTEKTVTDVEGELFFSGYYIDGNGETLVLLMKLPGQSELVRKKYALTRQNGRWTITLEEFRRCTVEVETEVLECPEGESRTTQPLELLPEQFQLNRKSGSQYDSFFDGLTPFEASMKNPPENGYLELALTIKPTEYGSLDCGDPQVGAGTCYSLRTTLNAGAI